MKREIRIPLILTGIFILFSFVPILQILIFTYDGGLLSVFQKGLFNDEDGAELKVNLIVNLPLAIAFFAGYYFASSKTLEVLFSFLAISFLSCFIFFLTADSNNEETDLYFLKFIIIALIAGSVATMMAMLKYIFKTKASTQH